jgi:hypothetical protein
LSSVDSITTSTALHDALSDWETALRLDPRNVQVKRLVEFARSA